ncbi:MAG: PIN domain-containing protein [Candidatus Omnitrophica bacterium]|nr:PIN domain-containing protein [Candidatus Omnitrophota bacterium]
MALVLIDTSAWIFNFPPRTIQAVRERVADLLQRDLAAVTSPILFELLQGARSGDQFRQMHQHLSSLHQFPVTEADWLKAAQWAHRLRSRGVTAKTVDFLIAYKAMRHKLTLLHADGDFDRLARVVPLKVESFVRRVRSGI